MVADQKTEEAQRAATSERSQRTVADLRTHEAQVAEAQAEADRQAAQQATDRATQQQHLAESREFAAKGDQVLSVDRSEALRFGAFAITKADTLEAEALIAQTRSSLVCRLPSSGQTLRSPVYSPDGMTIVTIAGDDRLASFSASTCRLLRVIPCVACKLSQVTFSPDGRLLATVDRDSLIEVWDPLKATAVLTLKAAAVPTLYNANAKVWRPSFSDDGAFISFSSGSETQVWSVTGKRKVMSLRSRLAVFLPRSNRLMALLDPLAANAQKPLNVSVLEVPTGELVSTLADFDMAFVNDFIFSPDGRLMCPLIVGRETGVWDVVSGRRLYKLTGHTREIWSAAFSPDGKYVATGSMDQTLRLWRSSDGHPIASFGPFASLGQYHGVGQVLFTPDGKDVLARVERESTIRMWNLESRRETLHLDLPSENVDSAAMSPDGKFFSWEQAAANLRYGRGMKDGLQRHLQVTLKRSTGSPSHLTNGT